jgi:hypothetical protein
VNKIYVSLAHTDKDVEDTLETGAGGDRRAGLIHPAGEERPAGCGEAWPGVPPSAIIPGT